MTGFGLGESEAQGLTVRAEIRSVNHRFLQVRYRLPSEFADLEPKVDAVIKKRLSRGSVTLTVSAARSAAPAAVVVDEEVAERYLKLLSRLARKLKLENDLKLSDLVSLPGVAGTSLDDRGHQQEGKVLLSAVATAVENLVEMREVEGRSLVADIEKQSRAVARLRKRIAGRMPHVVAAHFSSMQKRAQDLLGGEGSVEPRDLARELALLTERTDVSEEISRLESHLDQLAEVLAKGGEVGRKLDFLVQELYREANTVGSKCNDAQVAHAVVELKTHIERVREQVQNLE